MTFRPNFAGLLPLLTLFAYITVTTVGAFTGGLWAAVGIGYALALYFGTAYLDRRWPRPSRDVLALALIALAVMAALNLASIDPQQSWFDWLRLSTIFLPLALLTAPEIRAHAAQQKLFTIMAATAMAGAFALGVELVLSAPLLHLVRGERAGLTGYNRGLSYLVVLSTPILASLWMRRPLSSKGDVKNAIRKIVPFALFVVVLLFPSGLTESRASKLALVLALLTIIAAHVVPKVTRWSLAGLTILLSAWPLVVQKAFVHFQDRLASLPDSWRHRLEIWDYMSYRIAEHPWRGWGLGTSKLLDYKDPHGELYQVVTAAAPHPHNAATQLWVELGAPGIVLGIGFALLTLRQASRLSPPLMPFAYGAWMAAVCLSCVAYNFWTDSMFAAFALTGFAFALLDRKIKG